MGEISFSPLTWLPQTLLDRVDPSTGRLLVLGGSSLEKHVAGISSVFQFMFLKSHIGILIGIYLNLYNGEMNYSAMIILPIDEQFCSF